MFRTLLRVFVFSLVIAGISAAVVYRDAFSAEALQQWMTGFGATGPVVFVLIYAVATVLLLPGSILTLAGGALFGPAWGTFFNLTGATLGATVAFLVARYLAGNWVEQRSGGRIRQLKNGVEAEGWRFVAFVRLVPLFPFNLLNYALGLTRIPLSHYVLASYFCMLPAALAYTYLGYMGREALGGGESLIEKGLLGLGLLAVVAFLPRLVGHLRRGPMLAVEQLHKHLAADDKPLVVDVRSAEEFEGELGHIPGALSIPLDELGQRIDALSPYLEKTIAIVCHTDKRSAKAALLLGKLGYGDVHVVQGGMMAWNRAGFQIE